MAKRMELVLGPGDFENHGFQPILVIFNTLKCRVPPVDLKLQTVSEALVAAFRTAEFRRTTS